MADIKFSPAMPMPPTFNVEEHICRLYKYLDPKDPNFQPVGQHKNIRAAIKLYQDGTLDGFRRVSIMDGKIVSREEAFRGKEWVWSEVVLSKSIPLLFKLI
jgi:hypothetical protein